jgi:hypothetical protein
MSITAIRRDRLAHNAGGPRLFEASCGELLWEEAGVATTVENYREQSVKVVAAQDVFRQSFGIG